MKQGENMEKQMQETVEETKEGVTADMLFSACIEEKLPAEMLAAFDVTECLSSKPDCETLLLRDKQTGQKVVAKCYDRTEGMRQQEILCLKNKACPAFIGSYENDGYFCVLREYVEGVPLSRYVRDNYMAEDRIREIAVGLAETMRALHETQPVIIHRDIKPQNIIIRPDGSLALIDFGISRIYKKGAKEDTVFSGTEEFAAPEQFGFKQTDIRSDIYSYGVVLSYLLTGKAKPIKEPVTPLEKVAARCCAFVPEKRYQNDKSLCRALQKTTRQYRRRKNRIAFASCLAGTVLSFCLAAMAGWYVTNKEGRRVSFREPLIEKAVCAYLGKEEGTVTYKDLNKVLGVYVQGNEVYTSEDDYYNLGFRWYLDGGTDYGSIQSLEDLSLMPNLRQVCIGGNRVRDIAPLKELDYLESVELRNNQVTDISALAGKEYLYKAGFLANPLEGIEALGTCKNLRHLDLNQTGDYDGSPLAELHKLDELNLREGPDATAYLKGAEIGYLSVGRAGMTDVDFLRDVTFVEGLSIQQSEISDISALAGRTDINRINMAQCEVTDFTPLFSMPSLTWVEMSADRKEYVDAAAASLGEPQFEIVYVED